MVAVSVCIVTGRRLPALDACLASLQAQLGAPGFEVLVCSDGDPDVAATVHARFPDAEVCLVPRALPGAARNLLVERAKGDLLLFLDDDVTVEPHLLAHLHDLAQRHPEAGVFGGPNDTPAGSTRFQAVQGAVLASIVGSGPVRRRYGAHPPGYADERFFILCNLAVRREVMVPFANDLLCAEENAVLAELAHRGVPMFYDPHLVAYHERRPTLRGFLQQMHKYGRGRGQLAARSPGDTRPSYLAPTALLGYVLTLPVVAPLVGPLALAPLGAYLLAVGACAAWIARTLGRPADVVPAAALIVLLHAAYGSGVPRGMASRTRTEEAPTGAWSAAGQAGSARNAT